MKVQINVPDSLKDITLEQYQKSYSESTGFTGRERDQEDFR